MTGIEGCLDAVRAAAGKALSDDDLDRVFSAVQARMRKRAGANGDRAAAARQAAAELGSEARLAAMIEKRSRAINVLRRQALDARTVEGQEVRSVEAALTGVNHHGTGNARSVDATRHGLFAQLAGPMVAELRKSGLIGTLTGRDRGFDRDVARELWRLEDPAAEVARILHGAQEAARAMQNEAGAWIGKLDHYVTRQSHDMLKVRGAGDDAAFRQWAADILPRLDERSFDHLETPEQVAGFLRATWQALASGVHDTATGAEWLAGFKGPGNLAKKASQERVLHFKSADDWFAYNDKYGKGAVVDSMISGLDHAARNTALMRMFGTNPEAMFDAWVHDLTVRARDHGDFSQVDALKQSKNQRILDVLTGKAGMPENSSLAQISQGVRNVQSLAKLGGVLLSSIPDIGVIAATLRHNGIPLLEGYAHAAWSALPGRHTEATREIADLLACGIDGMLGHIHSRFSAEDGIPGMLSKSVELMHRLNGLTWWTDSHKTGVGLILSHNLARNAEHGFVELPARLRVSLERYGIGPAEWEALRSGPVKAADGRTYMTRDTVRSLGNDALDPLIAEPAADLRAAYAEHERSVKAADAKDGARVARELATFRAELERDRSRLQATEARRTEATAGTVERLRARVDRLTAQIEDAETRAEIAGAMRKIDSQEKMRRLLDDVERGLYAKDGAERSDRVVERAGKRDMSAGEALGRRLKAAELRIKEIDARLQTAQHEAVAVTDAAHAAFEARWQERSNTLQAFVEGMNQRAAERVRALSEHGDRLDPQIERLRARKRDELETSLRAYLSDQAREAMTEPRAGDRAVATGGTRAGTAWGEAVRMLMQFKQYPVTYWRRSVMREFQRGDSTDTAGIVHLIVATTLLGYVSMTAKDLVKGRDPRQPKTPGEYRDVVMAAMVQGGGLGIMGDFLFGEANRLGGGFVGSLAGPVFGSLESAHQLFTAIRDGHDARAQGLQFLKNNAPFINLFYTRMALDYLVFYRLQEAMNPGYLRRYEARVKKQNTQTFWLSPSRSPYKAAGTGN
ncbi:MAG: hypothetical protein WCF85_11560 [Rhodospirillaceae bacterium]